jgi:hypothetical protein
MRVAFKPSISSTFGQMVKGMARVLGGRGGMAFFSEMCRKCNHQRAGCLYCQIQATHKGTYHACLNRLRHRHHRCSRPWRLLSPRSGRDAATTQTWIERIGRVAFILPATISLQLQMPAPVGPRPGLHCWLEPFITARIVPLCRIRCQRYQLVQWCLA